MSERDTALTVAAVAKLLGGFLYGPLVVRTYDRAGALVSSFEGRFDGLEVGLPRDEVRLSFDLAHLFAWVGSRSGTRLVLGELTAFRVRHMTTGGDALELWRDGGRVMEIGPPPPRPGGRHSPDPDFAADRQQLTPELSSPKDDPESAGPEEGICLRMMLPSREPLESVEVLSELVGWVGRRVSVFVGRPGDAGAASFTATIAGLDPEAEGNEFVLVRFEEGPGFVDLDPDVMAAYRVRLEPNEAHWLEFDREGHRALSIRLIGEADDTEASS
jgi:hypothetical protein